MTEMPWDNTTAQAEAPAPARQPRQKRQPKPDAAPKTPRKARAAKPPEEDVAPPRKSRKAKEGRPSMGPLVPMMIKCTVKEYADAVLGADAKPFVKIHAILAEVSKGARTKVIAEINKVFG